MREFTDTEFNLIQSWKNRCIKAEGERFQLTRTRYLKQCCGKLPGTYMKTAKTLKLEVEITPADSPCTLNFRISGCVPSFVDGKPSVCYTDIVRETIDYSKDRHKVYYYPNGDRHLTAGKVDASIDEELKAVIIHFFSIEEDIASGYAFLFAAMVRGYRLTGIDTSYTSLCSVDNFSPEDFLK